MLTAFCLAHAFLFQGVTEVPFRTSDEAIIIDVTVNGCKASLMFDTGFSGQVIMGDNLNIGKPSGTQNLTDFVGSFEAKTVDMKTFKVGDRSIDCKDMKVVQQPSEHYTYSYGMHCDGILGLGAFNGLKFQINFEQKKLIFLPNDFDISTKKADGEKAFLTKLLPIGKDSLHMTVLASNGEKLYMVLDTGNAGYATTHKDVIERAKLWPEGKKASFMGQTVVASGPVDTFKINMSNVKIFGVPVPKCVFDVIDLPSSLADQDGTVGFQFLKNFNITIDQAKRYVLLENFTGKLSDKEPAEIGILAFPNPIDKRMMVYWVIPGSPAEAAGVKRGDKLIEVEGEDVSQIGFRQLSNLMSGDPGTKVKIQVSRAGQLMRFEVERKQLINDLGLTGLIPQIAG